MEVKISPRAINTRMVVQDLLFPLEAVFLKGPIRSYVVDGREDILKTTSLS